MATPRIDALVQDFHSALRRLRRAPGLCALTVSSLALGIGASTAIFSVARAVVFEPVPYRDAGRVVDVELSLHGAWTRMTEGQVAMIRERSRSLERVEAYSFAQVDWRRGDSTLRLFGQTVTPGLQSAMDMRLLAGRGFVAGDAAGGAEPAALISEDLWRREFDGAPDVVGTSVMLGDVRRTVIGVTTRPSSRNDVDVWLPREVDSAGDWSPSVIAWLGPGVSIEQARAELASLSSALPAARPGSLMLRLSRPGERDWSSATDRMLLLFWAASAFLVAIVCANLANILLARNLASRREVAIRAALGASRMRIARLHLAEALVLAVVGGLGAVLVSMWATTAFLALRPRSLSLVYPTQVPLDAAAVLYSLGLALLAGLLVGIGPALRAARANPLDGVVRDDPHIQGALPARWLFGGAVAAQAALAFVLLIGAGLMVSSYVTLLRGDPGFDPANVVQLAVRLDSEGYRSEAARREFFRDLADRVNGLGGVMEVAVATDVPPHNYRLLGAIEIEGRQADSLPRVDASWVHVTPGYFRLMRIPHLEGRPLADDDGHHGGVVVSESFARRYWPETSAIGQRFRQSRADGSGQWLQIVGVVGDVMGAGLRNYQADEIYLAFAVSRAEGHSIVARTTGAPTDAFQAMKEQVWALDPNVPIGRIRTLREALAGSIDEQPFYGTLLGAFSLVAVVLAGVGVFGVTAYAASQRRREIGIRIALGAQAVHVERLVVQQGLVPALAGILAGWAGGLALSRFMSSLVYGVSVTEPSVYVSTAVILAVVSLAATWLPARRASRVDPMLVLRSD